LTSEVDTDGQTASVVLAKGANTFIFNCIYAPKDHSIDFFANIYNKLAEQVANYPKAVLNIFGDINIALEGIDSVNRQKTTSEANVSRLIIEKNKILSLIDTFRAVNPSGYFTWVRDKCGTRLDMIFSAKCTLSKLSMAKGFPQ
jgi:exonuclease III